jgi:hypothetical protein
MSEIRAEAWLQRLLSPQQQQEQKVAHHKMEPNTSLNSGNPAATRKSIDFFNSEERIAIVRDHYVRKGYRVHSGLQFGCELVLYADDPSRVHSDFCVHIVPYGMCPLYYGKESNQKHKNEESVRPFTYLVNSSFLLYL